MQRTCPPGLQEATGFESFHLKTPTTLDSLQILYTLGTLSLIHHLQGSQIQRWGHVTRRTPHAFETHKTLGILNPSKPRILGLTCKDPIQGRGHVTRRSTHDLKEQSRKTPRRSRQRRVHRNSRCRQHAVIGAPGAPGIEPIPTCTSLGFSNGTLGDTPWH